MYLVADYAAYSYSVMTLHVLFHPRINILPFLVRDAPFPAYPLIRVHASILAQVRHETEALLANMLTYN